MQGCLVQTGESDADPVPPEWKAFKATDSAICCVRLTSTTHFTVNLGVSLSSRFTSLRLAKMSIRFGRSGGNYSSSEVMQTVRQLLQFPFCFMDSPTRLLLVTVDKDHTDLWWLGHRRMMTGERLKMWPNGGGFRIVLHRETIVSVIQPLDPLHALENFLIMKISNARSSTGLTSISV